MHTLLVAFLTNMSVYNRKLRQIAEAETIITNQIICTKCGAAGHIARDCVQKTPAELAQSQMVASKGLDALPANTIVGRQDRAKMDSEYMSLMAELGQVSVCVLVTFSLIRFLVF